MNPVSLPPSPPQTDGAALRQERRLREAAQGFEALFLNQIMKSAHQTSFGESLVESSATRAAQSMLDSTLSETAAGRAGLGLSEAIYRQFAGHIPGTKE